MRSKQAFQVGFRTLFSLFPDCSIPPISFIYMLIVPTCRLFFFTKLVLSFSRVTATGKNITVTSICYRIAEIFRE